MNRRERILAAIVAASLLVVGLNYGTSRVLRMLSDRSDRVSELTEDLKVKDVMKHRGTVARRVLDVYEARSLPSDRALASSRYRAWLHEWVENAKIKAGNVKYIMTRPYRDSHDRHTFSVICQADLPQLVQLLYEFYSTDYLHRIKHLSAKPLEGKTLSLVFTIEAISMPKATTAELGEMPSERLAFQTLDEYVNVIVNRNLYSPANQAPKLAGASTQRGYLNQRMSIRAQADDPEKNRVRYRLDEDCPEGMTIDQETGQIEWTPSEKGEFEFVVFAMDDGLPAKEASQTFKIEVTDPPPPAVAAPARPSFDDAQFTFVTGIVEVNGRRQVWLTVRTEGKWLRLFEGDSFTVGSFEGKITRIYPRNVEIESDNTLISVRYGQSINQGEVLREGKSEVATSQSP